MPQQLSGLFRAGHPACFPSGPFRGWMTASCSLVAGLASVALGGVSAPLCAQSRGTLQVAAQVLPAQPSQLALTEGLTAARLGSPLATGAILASIQVDRPALATDGAAARRPRAVVTISFLRN